MAPINSTNDDDHHEALVERQEKAGQKYYTPSNYNSIPIVCCSGSVRG